MYKNGHRTFGKWCGKTNRKKKKISESRHKVLGMFLAFFSLSMKRKLEKPMQQIFFWRSVCKHFLLIFPVLCNMYLHMYAYFFFFWYVLYVCGLPNFSKHCCW